MSTQPATRGPGRPSTGIDRKEQARLATAARRRNLDARTLQTEIPAGLYVGLKDMADRDGVSLKEIVTRLLESGYIADREAHGKSPAAAKNYVEKTRADMAAGLEHEKELLRERRARIAEKLAA